MKNLQKLFSAEKGLFSIADKAKAKDQFALSQTG